jgi:hypothetical protein
MWNGHTYCTNQILCTESQGHAMAENYTDLKCYTNAKPVQLKHSIKDAT